MSRVTTNGAALLRELFRFNDWAFDKVLALGAGLSDEQLDRPFPIGPGTLRETLRHHYGAERIWLERWYGRELSEFPHARDLSSIAQLQEAHAALRSARNRFIDDNAAGGVGEAGSAAGGLQRMIDYRTLKGDPSSDRLCDLLLHVVNHGVHHRAQALNMLRHSGVQVPPGLDYLFFRGEFPTVAQSPATIAKWAEFGFTVSSEPEVPADFHRETCEFFYSYSDWATSQLDRLAAELNDEQLDQPFEMGPGSLRKTLLHIRDAERWWLSNWTSHEPQPFARLPESTTMAALTDLTAQVCQQRDAFIASRSPDDWLRPLAISPVPGLTIYYRLGESMLQLPPHGTHHRAQVVNMLRRLGVQPPALDLVLWVRQRPRV